MPEETSAGSLSVYAKISCDDIQPTTPVMAQGHCPYNIVEKYGENTPEQIIHVAFMKE
jgi:hypothetical protein